MDIVPPKDKVLGEQETLMNPTPNQSVEGGSGSQNMNLDANCSESHQRKNEPSVYRVESILIELVFCRTLLKFYL